MTMIIALNAVPPQKTGLVAASIGITLTIGGIAGPLISGVYPGTVSTPKAD